MVSRNDHLTKLRDPAKAKKVGIAVIKSEAAGSLSCSCGGWTLIHPRTKVLEDRAQKHLDRKHNGVGVWL